MIRGQEEGIRRIERFLAREGAFTIHVAYFLLEEKEPAAYAWAVDPSRKAEVRARIKALVEKRFFRMQIRGLEGWYARLAPGGLLPYEEFLRVLKERDWALHAWVTDPCRHREGRARRAVRRMQEALQKKK